MGNCMKKTEEDLPFLVKVYCDRVRRELPIYNLLSDEEIWKLTINEKSLPS